MKTRKLLASLSVAFLGFVASALAQTQAVHATVAKVTGAATVIMPGGSTTALSTGMKVPQGATISTATQGEVHLVSHAGYVTTIKGDTVVGVDEVSVTSENGKVTKENTTLNLRSGKVVCMLDPKKKSVNNYQVRTPKGVAAARGTTFSVMIGADRVIVTLAGGNVEFTYPGGEKFSVGDSAGNNADIFVTGETAPRSLTTATPEERTQIAELIAAVAVAVTLDIGVSQSDFNSVMKNVVAAGSTELTNEVISTVKGVGAEVLNQAAVDGTAGISQEQVTQSTTTTIPTQREAGDTTKQPLDTSTISTAGR